MQGLIAFVFLLFYSIWLTWLPNSGYTMCRGDLMNNEKLSDEVWQAIVTNNPAFDGKIYYGVATTKVFCRPSCKSRIPLKEHVHIFKSIDQALSAHFRPCKRCKPDGLKLPNEEWITQIIQWIDSHYMEPLTLDKLADLFHGSAYHLHRTFKRIKGITPSDYIQKIRMEKAMKYLKATNQTVMEIATSVGIPNAAHFATLFQKKTGLTPTKYRLLYECALQMIHDSQISAKKKSK
jgi:AraC family transcriptional regulator, regulatory protein of adaptative response / methylphosphotriester-DNA alkyltransferase methyltransferase